MPERKSLLTERNFARFVVAVISIGFVALIVASAAALVIARETERQGQWVNHTNEVARALGDFGKLTEQIETAKRGALLSDDPRFAEALGERRVEAPALLDRIASLTRDNRVQQASVRQARDLLDGQIAIADRAMATLAAGDRAEAIAQFRTDDGANVTRALRVVNAGMLEEEKRLLAIRTDEQTRLSRLVFWIQIGAGLAVLLVAIASIWALRRYTADLNRSREQLAVLNSGLEVAVAARTTELQRANEEIQRFAYIVSHDLRSPLVNVMGFTAELDTARKQIAAHFEAAAQDDPEIAKTDAALAAREDLPEAIGFIRTSTQKMDRLINAILTLSRQGRRTLAPERVDMGALVQSIADTLQHRVDEAGAEIDIEGELPDIHTDRLAIEQIFSNLIENAVKYLKPGRPGRVAVRGRPDGARVVYEIEDNGRGIDPRDHERVFDLFRRSGSQDQPGEGIGLAHVRALAYRLGGLISCESALDRGATFRLSLPRKFEIGEGVSQ